MIKICVYFLILVIALPHVHLKSGDETLELVHVLFRHGDRTPEKGLFYPKDPHINFTFHPTGNGHLTNGGKLKAYLLGEELRKRYKDFLEPFSLETVDARSSDFARTKMSLQLVLSSLFPPEHDLVWKKNFQWQPIPASYTPIDSDHVLGPAYRNCPKYYQLYWDYQKSEENRNKLEKYTETIKFLSEKTGKNLTSRDCFALFLVLDMETEHNLTLPDWTQSVYPDVLKNLSLIEYHARIASPEMLRLSGGFLLKKIIFDTNKKIKGILPAKRKIFLYSAHEFNILQMLKILEIYNSHVPPYSAYIIFEIHNVNGVRKVKVFYQDYQSKNPRKMELPNCPSPCNFQRFVRMHKQFLPTSKDECKI